MTTEVGVKRAHQLSEEIADLVCDIKDRTTEMQGELGLNPLEIVTMVSKNRGPPVMSYVANFMGPVLSREAPDPMDVYIDKLFADRGVKVTESDTPAVSDVIVWIRGALHPVSGVLSKTPEGLLKLGSAGQMGQGGPAIMVDQVFAYEDVLSIAIRNEIASAPRSALFTGH